MKILIIFLIIVNIILFSTYSSLACQFNTDCAIGSKCLKKGLYGVCVGGLSPGNSNDRNPGYFPLDINGTYGDTCSFDLDCGIGSQCLKSGGLYGTCMKR